MKNTELVYGPVKFIKGELEGEYGFYDNDEGANTAIVYLGNPLTSNYVEIPRTHICNVSEKEYDSFFQIYKDGINPLKVLDEIVECENFPAYFYTNEYGDKFFAFINTNNHSLWFSSSDIGWAWHKFEEPTELLASTSSIDGVILSTQEKKWLLSVHKVREKLIENEIKKTPRLS